MTGKIPTEYLINPPEKSPEQKERDKAKAEEKQKQEQLIAKYTPGYLKPLSKAVTTGYVMGAGEAESMAGAKEESKKGLDEYLQYLQDASKRGLSSDVLQPVHERYTGASRALRAAQATGGIRGATGSQLRLSRQLAGQKAALDAAVRRQSQEQLAGEWKRRALLHTSLPMAYAQLRVAEKTGGQIMGMNYPAFPGAQSSTFDQALKFASPATAMSGLGEAVKKIF